MRTALVAGLVVLTIAALTAPAGGGGRLRPTGIDSADLRVSAGHAQTILSIRGLGRWTASCSARARVGVTFTADFLLPTSDLVVTPTTGRPLERRIDPGDTVRPDQAATVIAQHWQIAPFAAAQVQVSSATVTARRVDARTCSASVVVVTGPDQGATRTAAFKTQADLAWTLPAGWSAVGPRLTAVGDPAHRLAAATFALRQTTPDRTCAPETARRQMPPDGALVLLLENREFIKAPQRPPRFRLGPRVNLECFGLGRTVVWAEQGRAVQAVVMYGPRAGAERRRQAEALLDSLVVQPVPPPPPPAGWRFVVSDAADSMRVPPGWSARALRHKQATPRPRRLFRLANRDRTVVVLVREHRRGPASVAFPPAGEPLVFDAHRRAGMAWRGFRFSIRIFGRADASARDLEWAEISARTLGVSGTGRG